MNLQIIPRLWLERRWQSQQCLGPSYATSSRRHVSTAAATLEPTVADSDGSAGLEILKWASAGKQQDQQLHLNRLWQGTQGEVQEAAVHKRVTDAESTLTITGDLCSPAAITDGGGGGGGGDVQTASGTTAAAAAVRPFTSTGQQGGRPPGLAAGSSSSGLPLIQQGNLADLSNTLWALGRLARQMDLSGQLLPTGSLRQLEQLCCQQLQLHACDGAAGQLMLCCWYGFAHLHQPVPQLFSTLAAVGGFNFMKRLQSQHVAIITWAAAKLGHHDGRLFDRLLWRAVVVRGALQLKHVGLLLWAAGRVRHAVDPRAVAQLLQVTKQRHLQLKGRDLATILLGLMQLGLLEGHTSWFYGLGPSAARRFPVLFRELNRLIAVQLPVTRPHTLYSIVLCLARLGYYDARLYAKLVVAALQQQDDLNLLQLVQLAAAGTTLDQLGCWEPNTLVTLLHCHCQPPLLELPLADAYAEELRCRLDQASANTLLRLLQVLAAARKGPGQYTHCQLVASAARQLHSKLLQVAPTQLRAVQVAMQQLDQQDSPLCRAVARLITNPV
eukprot:gene13746-13865_t